MSPAFGNSAIRRPALAASCLLASLALPGLLAAPVAAASGRVRSIRAVDFRNFTYPLECGDLKTLTLRGGTAAGRDCFGATKLVAVRYVDFDGDGSEEAVVTLGTNCHASCWYVEDYFVFALRGGRPRQVFHESSGYRYDLEPPADFSAGVWKLGPAYGLSLRGRRLTLKTPAWDPDGGDANCCPRFKEKVVYEWRGGGLRARSRRRWIDPNGPGDPAASLIKR